MIPLILLIFSLLARNPCTAQSETNGGIIRVQNASFVDNSCKQFYAPGFNGWQVLESFASDGNEVRALLDEAVGGGLNIVRVFAHGVTRSAALQTQPGVYNQTMLAALDELLVELGKRKMRAILSFASYWSFTDGPMAYVSWVPGLSCNISACYSGAAATSDYTFEDCVASNCTDRDKFYTDPTARAYYRNHLAFMTSRVNTLTGVAYREDPVVFSWDLINEPNCREDICTNGTGIACADAVQGWIDEMATLMKSLDPNHLTTVGEDGFYGPTGSSNQQLAANPDNVPDFTQPPPYCPRGWSARVGQDFVRNHGLPSIDYAGIHVWANNWLEGGNKYVYGHAIQYFK